jgi:hypothetical protein
VKTIILAIRVRSPGGTSHHFIDAEPVSIAGLNANPLTEKPNLLNERSTRMTKTDVKSRSTIAGIMILLMLGVVGIANAGQPHLELYAGDWICAASTDSDKSVEVDGKNISKITITTDGKTYGTNIYLPREITPFWDEDDWDGKVENTNVDAILFKYTIQALVHAVPMTWDWETFCFGQLKDQKYGYLELECMSKVTLNQTDTYGYQMHCKRASQHPD